MVVYFIPFNKKEQLDDFYEMNTEYMTWVVDELDRYAQIDSMKIIGARIPELVNNAIDPFLNLKHGEGILLIASVDGKVAGMGAIKKLNESTGEIKRMYTRPDYRGRGIGKKMLQKLLETGREYGYKEFVLDTPKWAYAAQHIYKSAGFEEIEGYSESEIPQEFRSYWMFMKRKT
jgi:ribosomal protein S18 acetylase RimI-like enzyme